MLIITIMTKMMVEGIYTYGTEVTHSIYTVAGAPLEQYCTQCDGCFAVRGRPALADACPPKREGIYIRAMAVFQTSLLLETLLSTCLRISD